MKEVYLQD